MRNNHLWLATILSCGLALSNTWAADKPKALSESPKEPVEKTCVDILSEESITAVSAQVEYLSRVAKVSSSQDDYLKSLLEAMPELKYASLYMIGEEHGYDYPYDVLVYALTVANKRIDTVFLEVHNSYNGYFEAYAEGKIKYEDYFPRLIDWDGNLGHYVSEGFLNLMKRLGIRVIGVENPNTGSSHQSVFNIGKRNEFTANEIGIKLQNPYEEPRVSFDRAGPHKSKAAVYIGGAGHLMFSGKVMGSDRFETIPKILDRKGYLIKKIYITHSESTEWLRNSNAQISSTQPIIIKPTRPSPLLFPTLDELDPVNWDIFNLALVFPKKEK
ncbi:MAG: hypothetical protein AB7N80_01795 [Bdellovibrionales bacterium]